jgi:hypothetical protein
VEGCGTDSTVPVVFCNRIPSRYLSNWDVSKSNHHHRDVPVGEDEWIECGCRVRVPGSLEAKLEHDVSHIGNQTLPDVPVRHDDVVLRFMKGGAKIRPV